MFILSDPLSPFRFFPPPTITPNPLFMCVALCLLPSPFPCPLSLPSRPLPLPNLTSRAVQEAEETLLDYEDTEEVQEGGAAGGEGGAKGGKDQYVGLHGSGFRDFMLKPEIMRAIADCAFEHPSTGEWGWCVLSHSLSFQLVVIIARA